MSMGEYDIVVFHGVTPESRETIHGFLQGYIKLFEALGEEALYIGGIPLCRLGTDENDLLAPDPLSGAFPQNEGYFVIDISPRWAVLWGTSMGFFSTFLEQGLCTKITWYQEWEEGMCHILMNDDTEDTPNSWQFCEFVIGEDGVPSKYDDEDEYAEEKYNRFVADIMKGEVDVEWKDGCPSFERKERDELKQQIRDSF